MRKPRGSSEPKECDFANNRREEKLDVDSIAADGFSYNPAWTRGRPLNGVFGPSLARISVSLPLGFDFPIFIVYGWTAQGEPHMDITLSREIANGLRGALSRGHIHEISNEALWRKMG